MRIRLTASEHGKCPYTGQAEAGPKDALKEAEALFDEGAEFCFVINSLYYAMLYPVLALLGTRKIRTSSQNASIAQFDKEFSSRQASSTNGFRKRSIAHSSSVRLVPVKC